MYGGEKIRGYLMEWEILIITVNNVTAIKGQTKLYAQRLQKERLLEEKEVTPSKKYR